MLSKTFQLCSLLPIIESGNMKNYTNNTIRNSNDYVICMKNDLMLHVLCSNVAYCLQFSLFIVFMTSAGDLELKRGGNRRRTLPITNLQSIKIDCSLLSTFLSTKYPNVAWALSVSRSGCDFNFVDCMSPGVFLFTRTHYFNKWRMSSWCFFYCGRMSLGMMNDAVRWVHTLEKFVLFSLFIS